MEVLQVPRPLLGHGRDTHSICVSGLESPNDCVRSQRVSRKGFCKRVDVIIPSRRQGWAGAASWLIGANCAE